MQSEASTNKSSLFLHNVVEFHSVVAKQNNSRKLEISFDGSGTKIDEMSLCSGEALWFRALSNLESWRNLTAWYSSFRGIEILFSYYFHASASVKTLAYPLLNDIKIVFNPCTPIRKKSKFLLVKSTEINSPRRFHLNGHTLGILSTDSKVRTTY